jgi:hypothetical protein
MLKHLAVTLAVLVLLCMLCSFPSPAAEGAGVSAGAQTFVAPAHPYWYSYPFFYYPPYPGYPYVFYHTTPASPHSSYPDKHESHHDGHHEGDRHHHR